MKRYAQIVNPRQQPSERHYRREKNRYYDEELRDVYDGGDYNDSARNGHRDDFIPHDYYDDNYRFTPYDRQRTYSDYTPAGDFGYDRDEYYPMDPSHHHYRRSPATGYGNDRSLQARDFDDWREISSRHRNWEPRDFREHRFPDRHHEEHNRDFENGLYDYRAGQRYQERFRDQRSGERRSRRRADGDRRFSRFHNRSDRHPEIVTPFKEDRYYGRNDYNNTIGYGSNEFVYHDDEREPFEEGGDLSRD